MSQMSILGLYNYDPNIFNEMVLPAGVDKATAISTICLQNAELSLLYSDPETMRAAIGIWSTASQYSWNNLYETMTLEYNPIWNKDGTITETETIESSGEGSGTSTDKVSAFDETTFQNRAQTADETESSGSSERTYSRIEQGNIGVTSTQQLIKEQREISMFNIYDAISADFKQRFCIMVY